jgi:hypothetical protein
MDNSGDVDPRDSRGATPLTYAAASGSPHCVRLLLSKFADVNAMAQDGSTALLAAQEADDGSDTRREVLNLLIAKGAANAGGRGRKTPKKAPRAGRSYSEAPVASRSVSVRATPVRHAEPPRTPITEQRRTTAGTTLPPIKVAANSKSTNNSTPSARSNSTATATSTTRASKTAAATTIPTSSKTGQQRSASRTRR